ncbi:hypothetical protein [Mesorhizobium sp. M0060]|uniref:hypothetical protein n=1 Tax=Mesorhizobium sp. M0060 TaxID=2956866 RepID=UPI00333570FB
MQQTRKRLTSPPAVWEAAIAVARLLDLAISEAAEAVESYLSLMEIDSERDEHPILPEGYALGRFAA